jgi:hypothetical protein
MRSGLSSRKLLVEGFQSDRHSTFGAPMLNFREGVVSPLVSGIMRSRNQSQLVQLTRRSSIPWF